LILKILFPIIIPAFAIFSLWELNNYEKVAKRIEFSETIVQISKYMAQVRGFTYVYAHLEQDDQDLAETISQANHQLDKSFSKSLVFAEQLDSNNYNFLVTIQEKLQELLQINEIYNKDANLKLDNGSLISANEWFDSISSLISDLKELYMANFNSLNEDRKWLEMPTTSSSFNIRKAIWNLSELVGQERAIIGSSIAQGVSIPKEKTNARWLEIQKAWLEANTSMQGNLNNIALASAIEAIENNFIEKYKRLRQKIITESSTGANYSIDTENWLTQTTNAIDTLITVSELLSRNDIEIIASLELKSSIKRKTIFFVGAVVILILMTYIIFCILILLNYKRRVRKLKELYKISEELLLSASSLALERGILRASLASKTSVSKNLMQMVLRQREKINKLLLPALEDLQTLKIDKHNYLIEGVRIANEKVSKLRIAADKCLYAQNKNITKDKDIAEELVGQVFDGFTNLIVSTEELQLSATHSFAIDRQKTDFWSSNSMWYKNLTKTVALRHFIWIMSEHAGRQRALVGSAISSGNCIPIDKIKKMQDKIDSSWEIVKLEVFRAGKKNIEVREALEAVRNNFFDGEYPLLLKKAVICSQKNTNPPCYDIETDKWFDVSSKAIEKILELSRMAGRNSEKRLSKMINIKIRHYLFIMASCLMSIMLMILAINA